MHDHAEVSVVKVQWNMQVATETAERQSEVKMIWEDWAVAALYLEARSMPVTPYKDSVFCVATGS
jgi:hypothetical protein